MRWDVTAVRHLLDGAGVGAAVSVGLAVCTADGSPPAVLPASEGAPARAGRRFSAMDLPDDEERPLPRRSALSPDATRAMSPRTPDPELDPAVGEAARDSGERHADRHASLIGVH